VRTYRLQRRVYKALNPEVTNLTFPNDVTVRATLEPAETFGEPGNGRSRTVRVHSDLTFHFDANSGDSWAESDLIDRVDATATNPHWTLQFDGRTVIFKTRCETQQDLDAALQTIYYALPVALSVELQDAIIITEVLASVGDVEIRWEFARWSSRRVESTSTDSQETRLLRSIEYMGHLAKSENQRLLAAFHYFHVAHRLVWCGHGPWEFMSEAILNYAKVLDALFVTSSKSMNDVRSGLASLGCSDSEIESMYVPILVLRNHFDVGHVSTSVRRSSDLEVIYRYLENVEGALRSLLQRVVARLEDGSFTLPLSDPSETSEERRQMERLVEALRRTEEDSHQD